MDARAQFDRSDEAIGIVAAEPEVVFDFLDEHSNLSSHMERRSWMMFGTKMELFTDDRRAKTVGSRFGFSGSVWGLPLRVEEIVVERRPPSKKAWQTIGEPRLWVIGSYLMGFETDPSGSESRLRAFIEYRIPSVGLPRLLGRLFGRSYAGWCTARMVSDATRHFADRNR